MIMIIFFFFRNGYCVSDRLAGGGFHAVNPISRIAGRLCSELWAFVVEGRFQDMLNVGVIYLCSTFPA